MDFLVSSPIPQQIIGFHASDAAQLRIRYFLEQKRNSELTAEELAEMEEISQLNHFITLLKARAHKALQQDDLHS